MRQEKDSLLKKIIFKADSKRGDKTVNISTARQLLELSSVTYEKATVKEDTPIKHHDQKLFSDALEDFSFFFQQYLQFSKTGGTKDKIDFTQKRALKLFEFIEEDLTNYKDKLFELLDTKDKRKLTATIYILSSVERDKETSPCLNKALAKFSTCEEEHLPCYINGLKQGRHLQLKNGLKLIKELATPEVKEACEKILESITAETQCHASEGVMFDQL